MPSGGTIAGLSLGSSLSKLNAKVCIFYPISSLFILKMIVINKFSGLNRCMHFVFVMTPITSMNMFKAYLMDSKLVFVHMI